jgi:hypothetical protein
VLLGGQMKYDLILSSELNNTYISNIHISPISKDVPYSKYIEDNILNYSHSENIMNFYKKIENYFYKDFANPLLNNVYPLPENYSKEISEITYNAGCRRMKYHLYNKQFEYFCPIWLEQIDDIRNLKFNINVYTKETDVDPLISRIIKFDQSRIIDYFNNYIKQLGLIEGCDWVFDINKNKSILTGLNVKNGKCENKELIKLYKDLVYIERPLLEFNNIIINTINSNHMITKQLFNFNLCFNFEDILNPFLINELNNHSLYIDVIVTLNDQALTLVDIFSNHTNISKNIFKVSEIKTEDNGNEIIELQNDIHRLEMEENNVLEYLNDHNCIDLIDKNKFLQNTCHWCYSEEPNNSSFNMYDGFSLLYRDKHGDFKTIPYYNGNVPNLQVNQSNVINYPFWCNNFYVKKYTDSDLESILPFLLKGNKYDDLFSNFSSNCVINGINYKTKSKIDPIKVIAIQYDGNIGISSSELRIKIKNILSKCPGWGYGYLSGVYTGKTNDVLFINPYDNSGNDRKIIFICKNIMEIYNSSNNQKKYIYYNLANYKNMFYRNVLKDLENIKNKPSVPVTIKEFYEILKSPNSQYSQIINFDKTLTGVHAPGPSLGSKEIYYCKKNTHKLIIRGLGKIKPYFLLNNDKYYNNKYIKHKLNELGDNYQQYLNTNYGPKYPSIGYFASTYEKENYNVSNYIKNNIEYQSYRYSRIFDLQQVMNFKCVMENGDTNDKIKQQIEHVYGEALHAAFKDENDYERNLKYIMEQYKLVHTNIDYTDKEEFIYEMQIKLK